MFPTWFIYRSDSCMFILFPVLCDFFPQWFVHFHIISFLMIHLFPPPFFRIHSILSWLVNNNSFILHVILSHWFVNYFKNWFTSLLYQWICFYFSLTYFCNFFFIQTWFVCKDSFTYLFLWLLFKDFFFHLIHLLSKAINLFSTSFLS